MSDQFKRTEPIILMPIRNYHIASSTAKRNAFVSYAVVVIQCCRKKLNSYLQTNHSYFDANYPLKSEL
jgi:hypothetical protein